MYVNVTRVLEPGLGRKSRSAEDLQKKRKKKEYPRIVESRDRVAFFLSLSLSSFRTMQRRKRKGKEKEDRLLERASKLAIRNITRNPVRNVFKRKGQHRFNSNYPRAEFSSSSGRRFISVTYRVNT